MKITIDESEQYEGIEITIKCKKCDDEVLSVLARLKADNDKILGSLKDKTYILNEKDILYFDSVDKKCFIYTQNNVYETASRLYELEQTLTTKGFIRITKSSIVNIAKIKSIQASFNSTLILEMENGEKLSVSRQYAPTLKERLGK